MSSDTVLLVFDALHNFSRLLHSWNLEKAIQKWAVLDSWSSIMPDVSDAARRFTLQGNAVQWFYGFGHVPPPPLVGFQFKFF